MQCLTGGLSLRFGVILSSIIFLCLFSPIGTSQQPEPPGWDLGIEYPLEDEDNPFKLSSSGFVTVTFFVSNNELLPITVEFDYDIPFDGAFDGPESETIGAGNNKTFSLSISGIDVRDNPAETTEEFSITAILVSRGSVPQPIPDSRTGTGELIIPTIYDLEVRISEPVGPMNSGSEMTLAVYVENLGNVMDRVGSVEVSDNCPLLTVSNDLDTTKDIVAGNIYSSPIVIAASQSHPQRNCDVEVMISSNGATNSGGSEFAEDSVRVSVESPPTNQEDPESPDDNEDIIEEVVSSNLSFVGILPILSVILLASMNKKR
tara:strand:- start:662 stop:1615 length:954 start_codon:yes stop_codon:yes gene_type:complete